MKNQSLIGAAAVRIRYGGSPPPTVEIAERIGELLARFPAAQGEERLQLTLEYIRLKEALEDLASVV